METLEWDYNRKVPLEKMYRMMDHLYKNIEKAKSLVAKNTLSLFKQEVDVLFFDVTTLYFESFKPDEIRQFGYSKDCKFKETQVVLALVTNIEGHPLSYELFPGNTNEGRTLISVVERMKEDFRVRKAVLVADRAMFTDRNLEFMEERGLEEGEDRGTYRDMFFGLFPVLHYETQVKRKGIKLQHRKDTGDFKERSV